ncbi:hypothetical protein D9615_009254 [Tricholomella constricta]|uniref:Xylanolytic transcriptional activator regulatory domain-containing protein n=1 Tax=Tricholomella constricta TaxID=117010 RepID=A0A8H5LWA2_9AGAR|nr:hypothetical protein D9615_009254 [Tricholomella constricta]
MPPDPTRASSTRRTQRKITEEELKDIELKRIRGELSCAECRRLKLRCDKKVPCGILSAGQGTRFILADTEHLHKKIADMSYRIRQLEDALAILQATVSDQRHPLLQDELLKVKFGPEATESRLPSSSPSLGAEQVVDQSIDALGTLTLDDSGEVKYFGRSAGSETLMMAGDDWDDSSDDDEGASPASMSPELANLFPFSKGSNTKTLALLESHLPPHERACALAESYLNHGASFFRPIKRDELFDVFMPGIYKAASSGMSKNAPHALATLYFLFALGALLDLGLPPFSAEAEHYYELGRATLALRVVFDSPQVDTVQALGLMATYHCLAGKKYTRDSAWCVMSFAAKLAQGLGLHRDSARWNMDATTVQKRRTLFWEVFTADVSHSLALGRPPAMHLSYVDCEFPIDEEATLSDTGEIQNGFWRMKYTFGRDMFLAVADTTLVAKSPSYTTVLDLDRKVREVSFPTSFKPYVSLEDGEEAYYSSSLSLQGFYASQHRTVTMIYLHRSFFAQAMLDHPSNPLLSAFAPSFLTAYRCASIIIKASAHQFDRCAEMAMRAWFLMYHTFSAAIIVGTVVTRSPNSNVAPSALQDLTRAVELFERTAQQSQRAKVALGVLQKLKEKAIRAYTQSASATSPSIPIEPSGSLSPTNLSPFSSEHRNQAQAQAQDDGDDELAIFGGQTRVLSRKSRGSRRSGTVSLSMSNNTDSPSPHGNGIPGSPAIMGDASRQSLAAISLSLSAADVHPALVEYLGAAAFRDRGRGTNNNVDDDMCGGDSSLSSSSLAAHRPAEIYAALQPQQQHQPGKEMGNGDLLSRGFGGHSAGQALQNHAVTIAPPPSSTSSTFISSSSSSSSSSASLIAANSYLSYLQSAAHTQTHTQVQAQQEWRELSPDPNGLPKPDTSFNWIPPSSSLQQQQQRDLVVDTPMTVTGMHIDAHSGAPASSLSSYDPADLDRMLNFGDTGRGYHLEPAGPGNEEDDNAAMAMATDPSTSSAGGARLELGLMEGSDIDSGWLSFMQDCGIIDASLTPPLTLQQPLSRSESTADAEAETEAEAEMGSG